MNRKDTKFSEDVGHGPLEKAREIFSFHRAAMNGILVVINDLISSGIDIDGKDSSGNTALHIAAKRGNTAVIKCLIAAGANIDARTPHGHTPLHGAVLSLYPPAVECLIAAGADVNAKNGRGDTPLHWAKQRGASSIAECLIAAGADVSCTNHFGVTPSQVGKELDHHAVVSISTPVAAQARSIDEDVLAVLERGHCDAKKFFLPAGQLDRKLYQRTDEVLAALGGKWNRSAKAHVFEDDAQTFVQTAIWSKSFVRPQDLGFFPTPDDVADRLMDQVDRRALAALGDISSLRLLEPNAGSGSLVRAAMRSFGVTPAQFTCFEILPGNVKTLQALGVNVIEADFLAIDPDEFKAFDLVIMNPPFSNLQDVKHIEHASRFLHENGQLAAISSPSWEHRQNHTTSSIFRDLLSTVGAQIEAVPAGAFKSAGTNVATRMIHFHAAGLPWAKLHQDEPTVLDDTPEQIRYLASAGWGHIFVGRREETTRWIYDCAKMELVGAQVLNANCWVDLDLVCMNDLLESIHDNEAHSSPDDFGLLQFSELPSWQDVNDAFVSEQVLEFTPTA